MEEQKPISIHKYALTLKCGTLPPGIGDFIRGTIEMFNCSKKYGYSLLIDRLSHPLFEYLEPSDITIESKLNDDILELIPGDHMPGGYDTIDKALHSAYASGASFSCLTNAFHKEVTQECKEFMKKLLTPTAPLKQKILNAYAKTGIDPTRPYIVIHLRCGDEFLKNPTLYSPLLASVYGKKIKDLLSQNPDKQFVLLTDSAAMGKVLHTSTSVLYNDSPKLHLGLMNSTKEAMEDTLVELFMIAYSSVMLSNSRSGFSSGIADIWGQPYHPIF